MKRRQNRSEFIAALDVGTTKVSCLIAELSPDENDNFSVDGTMNCIGFGTAICVGLRKGVVINIEATVDAIVQAVSAAQAEAGVRINKVIVGIAGGHIRSFNSTGIVPIKEEEISKNDVKKVLEAATAVAIPLDRETIHIIPQDYLINDQGGIQNPVGMSGVRLEAKVHVVTAAISSAQNVMKCVKKAGLSVSQLVLEPIASSEAVLCKDEMELGVVLVDIGGGTSDVAVFKEGAIVYTGVLPLGGAHITADIAVALTTPQNEAEKLKVLHGCARLGFVHMDETIEVMGVGGRTSKFIKKSLLASIIEPRVEEMLELIHKEILKSGYKGLLSAGVVMTGGATLLEGMPEFAEEVLGMPVKRGFPQGVSGLKESLISPRLATAVGLLKYGSKNSTQARFTKQSNTIYTKVKESMGIWIKDLF